MSTLTKTLKRGLIIISALPLVYILTGCGGGSSPVQMNTFYSAYQIGTEWTYRQTYSRDGNVSTYTERVVGTKSIDGVNCLDIEITASDYGESFHSYTTASDQKGVLVYDNMPIPILPSPIMKYPPFPFRDIIGTGTLDGEQIRVLSACTTVDTISGHYDNAVKLEYYSSSPNYEKTQDYVWLVPGVGMVKRQVVQKRTGNVCTTELESFAPKI